LRKKETIIAASLTSITALLIYIVYGKVNDEPRNSFLPIPVEIFDLEEWKSTRSSQSYELRQKLETLADSISSAASDRFGEEQQEEALSLFKTFMERFEHYKSSNNYASNFELKTIIKDFHRYEIKQIICKSFDGECILIISPECFSELISNFILHSHCKSIRVYAEEIGMLSKSEASELIEESRKEDTYRNEHGLILKTEYNYTIDENGIVYDDDKPTAIVDEDGNLYSEIYKYLSGNADYNFYQKVLEADKCIIVISDVKSEELVELSIDTYCEDFSILESYDLLETSYQRSYIKKISP